jgi:hypothetical protein
MLSLKDEAVARQFFSENTEDFGHWIKSKDENLHNFFGVTEAAAVFVALCAALQTLGPAMDNIDKIVKHTRQLIRFAKRVLGGFGVSANNEQLELRERVLILVFENYMRSKKGITTQLIASLTGSKCDDAEEILKRFENSGIISAGKTGWVVAC